MKKSKPTSTSKPLVYQTATPLPVATSTTTANPVPMVLTYPALGLDSTTGVATSGYAETTDPTEPPQSANPEAKGMEMEMPYVPFGVYSLADALAAKEAQEKAHELSCLLDTFQQVAGNIASSSEVE